MIRLAASSLFIAIVVLSFAATASRPAAPVIPAEPTAIPVAAFGYRFEPDLERRTRAPEPRPTSSPAAAVVPTRPAAGVHSLTVTATWYCSPTSRCTAGWPASCLCAAVSPDLHLPRYVTVGYHGRTVRVRIVDCNCQATNALDLYASAFSRLAPLSAGRITARVSW